MARAGGHGRQECPRMSNLPILATSRKPPAAIVKVRVWRFLHSKKTRGYQWETQFDLSGCAFWALLRALRHKVSVIGNGTLFGLWRVTKALPLLVILGVWWTISSEINGPERGHINESLRHSLLGTSSLAQQLPNKRSSRCRFAFSILFLYLYL